MKSLLTLSLLLLPTQLSAAASSVFKHDHIEVQLLASDQVNESGERWLGLRLKPEADWHVYWQNPGDSGQAPQLEILAPDAAKLGAFIYPPPERLEIPPLTNIGYSHEILLPIAVHLDSASSPMQIRARWLVCQETCLPGEQIFEVAAPGTSDPEVEQALEAARAHKPQDFSAWTYHEGGGAIRTLSFKRSDLPWADGEIAFFPTAEAGLKSAKPEMRQDGDEINFILEAEELSAPPQFGGLLTLTRTSAQGEREQLSLALAAPGSSAQPAREGLTLSLILFAFLGGLILNVMPCVLPILSLKLFSLMKDAGEHRSHAIRASFAYAGGILVSMLLLGVALEIAKSSGQALGWGFQLQSPVFIGLMVLLFVLLAFNFLGLWNPWDRLMMLAGRAGNGKAMGSDFGTGVLAVAVASPCTGPFMGVALGAALGAGPLVSFTILLSLGLGFAAPLVVLALLPKRFQWLPKPGMWMEHLRQFFAFPLLATAVWLLSVLDLQLGRAALYAGLGASLLIGLGIWTLRIKGGRWLSPILIVGAILGLSVHLSRLEKPAAASAEIAADVWQAFDPKSLPAWTAEGPVFVDFTAAWCVSCQVNKLTVLSQPDIIAAFQAKGVRLVRADWTDANEEIGTFLSGLGREGIPVYAFYAKGAQKPELLPEILTKSLVLNKLATLPQP